MDHGILSLLPPILALVCAMISKDILLALFLGILSASVIANGWGFFPPITDTYLVEGIVSNADVFLRIFLLGAFLAAIKRAGGITAFTNLIDRKFNTPRKSKFITWLLSLVVINEPFAFFGIGSIMRPVTDRHRVSHEKFGFIQSSTAENICALVPITIYILFFGGIASATVGGDGNALYLKSIPLNFFCILAIVYALLSALEIIPDFGTMKRCETRARETGALIREGSHPLSSDEIENMKPADGVKPDLLCFVLPFATYIGTIVIIYATTGSLNLGPAVLLGFLVAVIYPMIRGYIGLKDISGIVYQGTKSMMPVCLILAMAFAFGKAIGDVGFANYVVAKAQAFITPNLLPFFAFILCCLGSYVTGSLISISVVLTPIVLALGVSTGANIPMLLAAIVGGSTFGDCSSPLSDIVLQAAMGANVDAVDLSKAQLGPRLIVVGVSALLYLVLPFVMG